MVSYGYDAGFKAIKQQIYPAMMANKADWNEAVFEKLTFSLLNRTCPGWMK